jgi:plastocyanin/heme-degrading monooxygenase HmoA
MEYVQQVQALVAADKLGDARTLFDDLEAHRRDLRGLRGFLSMSIGRSVEAGGDTLVTLETRWKDEGALNDYLGSARNAQSILHDHSEILVADSVTARRLEGVGTESPDKGSILAERVFTSLAVPLVIFGLGLAIVYALSRVYLEIGPGAVATTLAIVVAGGILLVAWYFAQNQNAPVWQMGAVGAVAAALLIGGTVWAAVDDRYPPAEGFGRDHVGGEPTEPPTDGTPTAPGNVIEMDDNVFVFNGEENPNLTAAAGTEVTFELSNVGNALHNMHIAAGGDYDAAICAGGGEDPCSDPPRINGGDDGTITFNLPAGTYDYRCDFHTVEMVGTLTVQ